MDTENIADYVGLWTEKPCAIMSAKGGWHKVYQREILKMSIWDHASTTEMSATDLATGCPGITFNHVVTIHSPVGMSYASSPQKITMSPGRVLTVDNN